MKKAMIRWIEGDYWESEGQVEALVNTVNTQGVMGKGLALEFKQRYPENFEHYQEACESGQLQIGKLLVFKTGKLMPQYIINFPTKKHWRSKSKLEYIEQGLEDLVEIIRTEQIKSIAIPPLGCGLGGLKWRDVKPLIQKYLEPLQEVEIRVYEPSIVPPSEAEACFLAILDLYNALHGMATQKEAEQLGAITHIFEKESPKRRSKRKDRAEPKSQSFSRFLNQLAQKRLIVEHRLEKQKLYAVPEKVRPLIERTLQQSTEWQKRRDTIAELISRFDSLAGLEVLNTLYQLKRDPFKEPYLRKVIQWLEQVDFLLSSP